jgi:hypothetical protein
MSNIDDIDDVSDLRDERIIELETEIVQLQEIMGERTEGWKKRTGISVNTIRTSVISVPSTTRQTKWLRSSALRSKGHIHTNPKSTP